MLFRFIVVFCTIYIISCNSPNRIEGKYHYSTKHIDSSLLLKNDGTFEQVIVYSGKTIKLNSSWQNLNGIIEFNKIYFLTEFTTAEGEKDLLEPKLYYLASFSSSPKMLYVKDQRQVYRKSP